MDDILIFCAPWFAGLVVLIALVFRAYCGGR